MNKHILINAVMINESKDSSAIENIITTYLSSLEKEGFLASEKIGKERIYVNAKLYDLVRFPQRGVPSLPVER
ncbi:Fic/DOC family N-terminal domain-containing protein [Anaerotalea alkaliphila]|uniref:Adenylyltransferase SoFic-like C-terminal domain-containing protein n=1 Tax=Anaerotalea alkaliphila TaxID=2662126 RepID=A0A7X5HX45_9FIRM|nr:hypothetical protein [Anaerotalea alkaliphila]NDL68241.1 hypothetical protein [Anaerotalea alkaliphila]